MKILRTRDFYPRGRGGGLETGAILSLKDINIDIFSLTVYQISRLWALDAER